jgi:hypothetical protein
MNREFITDNDPGDQHTRPDADPLQPATPAAAEPGLQPPESNRDLSTVCWSIAAILLGFLCLTHLGVLLCFSAGTRVPGWLAPAALPLALAVGDWLVRREGIRGRWRIAPPAIAATIVALSLVLAGSFFDFGWDGQWYHQTAVYQMAHGWNPLRDPMHSFLPDLETWVRYYAKGPWYVALALFQTTHNIECAKAATWIALAASCLAVFAVSLDFGRRGRVAFVIASLVALNPVVFCELASYLVDGLVASFLACFIAAMIGSFRRPGALTVSVAIASAILCINAKQTGLVYVCFAMAAGGVYVLARKRDRLVQFAISQLATVLLGAALFGFNPYVTNTVHRGNPFYPWVGTAANPGFSQRERDPNERYETPANLVGRNRVYRLAYSIFGRPGAQPVTGGANAQLMWPFDVGWNDFNMFRIHGVRVAGFGPLFSGALLIGLGLLGLALIRPGGPRLVLALLAGAIAASLLIGTHTWWARYVPQLWWLPVVAVIGGLAIPNRRTTRWVASGLAALLLANATLIAFAHFRWEIAATRTLREQMAFLRAQESVEVDFAYFGESFGERLRAAGVSFRAVQRLQGDHPMELMSVAPGYPGAVRVCVHGSARSPSSPSH